MLMTEVGAHAHPGSVTAMSPVGIAFLATLAEGLPKGVLWHVCSHPRALSWERLWFLAIFLVAPRCDSSCRTFDQAQRFSGAENDPRHRRVHLYVIVKHGMSFSYVF